MLEAERESELLQSAFFGAFARECERHIRELCDGQEQMFEIFEADEATQKKYSKRGMLLVSGSSFVGRGYGVFNDRIVRKIFVKFLIEFLLKGRRENYVVEWAQDAVHQHAVHVRITR